MSDISNVHKVIRLLHETAIYPPHPPRTESELYRQNHHQLIYVEGQGCAVCGGKEKLETHHVHCEWAFANAVDWAQMKELHPDFPDWNKVIPGDESTYFNFIDSRYNLLVLCE